MTTESTPAKVRLSDQLGPANEVQPMPEPAGFRTRYRSEPGMIGHYPWTYADAGRRKGNRPECEYEDLFTADQLRTARSAERDCRTCKNWTPHHRSDVMHCSAALRCVAGSSYQRQGVVQLWESAPADAGF